MPKIEGYTSEQIDAAAKALREDAGKGKRLNEWERIPNSSKGKWWHKAYIALSATV